MAKKKTKKAQGNQIVDDVTMTKNDKDQPLKVKWSVDSTNKCNFAGYGEG